MSMTLTVACGARRTRRTDTGVSKYRPMSRSPNGGHTDSVVPVRDTLDAQSRKALNARGSQTLDPQARWGRRTFSRELLNAGYHGLRGLFEHADLEQVRLFSARCVPSLQLQSGSDEFHGF